MVECSVYSESNSQCSDRRISRTPYEPSPSRDSLFVKFRISMSHCVSVVDPIKTLPLLVMRCQVKLDSSTPDTMSIYELQKTRPLRTLVDVRTCSKFNRYVLVIQSWKILTDQIRPRLLSYDVFTYRHTNTRTHSDHLIAACNANKRNRNSGDSVVKAMDLHLVNLGSTPEGTCMSHWWQQERHVAKTAPVHQYKSHLSWQARPQTRNLTLNSDA